MIPFRLFRPCLIRCAELAAYLFCLTIVFIALPVQSAPVSGPHINQIGMARPTLSGLTWLNRIHLVSQGKPLVLDPFRSDLDPAGAAKALATHFKQFQRLQVFPGLVILSGLQGQAHWLAYVQRSSTGSRGYVSSLPFKGVLCSGCE